MELKDSDVGLQLTVAGDEGGEGGSFLLGTQPASSPASSSSTDDVIIDGADCDKTCDVRGIPIQYTCLMLSAVAISMW